MDKSTGKFLNDDVPVFNFQNLSVGDVIEIFYELQFNANYGSNLFYLNSKYPKINCEYEFVYKFENRLSECEFILPIYVPDSAFTTSSTANHSYLIKRDKVKMRNLGAINYPANSYEGRSLPHVFVDFGFYRSLTGYYSTPSGKVKTYTYWRSKNFQWLFIKDTVNHFRKNNRSKFESLRKYIANLPPIESDSNCKAFITALCDTLNSFRYLSYNQLFYNESQLYDLSRVDHLLKRRLVGSADLLWQDIFNDNNIFYYRANLEDLRYSDHSLYYRGHLGYEGSIFAVPYRTSYLYFIPRYGGINYHINELPFYYEGALACLFPKNFQENTPDKGNKTFKFVKMHKGTFNENTRTENATIFIPLDSLKTRLVIKESLSGQFSTVLRHLYLNEYIDSTISPHYFKKCTQKPNASDVKIKLSSKLAEFPFRYNFSCSEKITRLSLQDLDLKNWFSFPISREVLPEVPAHDYYLDFGFSDAYNFMLQFSSPVNIENADAFSKKINNELFELESGIVKNSESTYLLQVRLVIKETKVPLGKTDLLMNLVAVLEELNAFKLQLEKKGG